jgi:hypothetical protein
VVIIRKTCYILGPTPTEPDNILDIILVVLLSQFCVLHFTEPANYTGSYTEEYRVIIACILLKGVHY